MSIVAAESPRSTGAVAPPPPSMPLAPKRFLGRQPILDANKNLYGYELLFRSNAEMNYFTGDVEDASRQVIDNCLTMIPAPGQGMAFVNCTRDVLVDGVATILPPRSTVLEILETVEPDEEVLAACAALTKAGYMLALDDFAPDKSKQSLIEHASIIKVDFRASNAVARRKIKAMAAGMPIKLLAEKVETLADFNAAKDEGYEYFQGYFFSKPVIRTHHIVPQNHLTYLRLLVAVSQVPADLLEIEKLIMSDASLCFRLLRLVNSAIYKLPCTVTSIRSALVMVGQEEVRKLVSVALAGAFAASSTQALVSLAIERARFCELLAPALHEQPSKLYLLGMLSLIDGILNIPMSQVLASLPLDQEMKAALLAKKSSVGIALDLVRSYESGNWQQSEAVIETLGLTEATSTSFYAEAVLWADKMITH